MKAVTKLSKTLAFHLLLIYRKRSDRIQYKQTRTVTAAAVEWSTCSLLRTTHVSDQHLESYLLEQWIETIGTQQLVLIFEARKLAPAAVKPADFFLGSLREHGAALYTLNYAYNVIQNAKEEGCGF